MNLSSETDSLLKLNRCLIDGKAAAYLAGGNGPRLLFIHGWAASPYFYRLALEAVAESGYRVIAPFLPGSGPSESFGRSWPASSEVSKWMGNIVEMEGGSGLLTVVGHSLGGGIAAHFAHDYPLGIERLFLLSSVGGHHGENGESMEMRSIADWSLSLPLDLANSALPYRHLVAMVGSGIRQFIRNPIGMWRLSRLARNYQVANELSRLGNSKMKIYVVGALDDRVITADSVIRIANYASVEPIWVEGTHSWLSTNPQSLADLLSGCH